MRKKINLRHIGFAYYSIISQVFFVSLEKKSWNLILVLILFNLRFLNSSSDFNFRLQNICTEWPIWKLILKGKKSRMFEKIGLGSTFFDIFWLIQMLKSSYEVCSLHLRVSMWDTLYYIVYYIVRMKFSPVKT